MSSMTNMALTKTERKTSTDMAVESEKPKYPFGLEVRLDDETLSKLGVEELPKVGMKLILEARVVVESVSEAERTNRKPQRHVGLQITDMSLSENPGDKQSRHAGVLYSSGKP